MNLAVISIIFFIITIAIGVIFKVNCGIVAMATSFVLVQFFAVDMSLSDIYKMGWPVGTFFMMLSVLLLFGIAGANGTMEIVARKLVTLLNGKTKIMPFFIFILTLVLSGSGAGPGIAPMVMVIAMGICKETGLSCFMMGITVECGAAIGGLSPVATSGIIAKELAAASGVTNYMGMLIPYAIAMTLEVVVVYIIFGGWKAKNVQRKKSLDVPKEKMTLYQKETLMIVCLVVGAILVFKLDVSMTAFGGAALLIILGVMQDKKAVATVNWNTLLMVSGMYMLITVVDKCGGMDLISNSLMSIITPRTGTGIMTFLSGVLATVTSSSGVVMPTLIPISGNIAAGMGEGVSSMMLMSGVIAGANCALFCPVSVLGSMTISLYPKEANNAMIFKRHVQMTFLSIIFMTLLGFSGFLNIFC